MDSSIFNKARENPLYKISTEDPEGVLLHTDNTSDYNEVENGQVARWVGREIRAFGRRRWYKIEADTRQEGNKLGWVASNSIKDYTIDFLIAEMERDDPSISSLKKHHSSLLFSFEQMLAYSSKTPISGMPEDIIFLLDTYREMAERFYIQYEISLLEEINSHPDLIPEFPARMQDALNKLQDEWLRLSTIVMASQVLTEEDEDLVKTLEWVVNAAAYFVGVEAERIDVVPGREFGLYFFNYLDNFAVLTVPIYSVRAPWEWSVIWHELAGYKVRRLERDSTEPVKENLLLLSARYRKFPKDEDRQKFLDDLFPGNRFCQGYLAAILSKEELDLSELGDFEHQFARMQEAFQMLKTPSDRQKQKAKKDWNVDWFKELFEDSWSVLAIGREFIRLFEEILKRHHAEDNRHPQMAVRLKVANKLVDLAENAYTEYSVDTPMEIEECAARQILIFISLLKAGTLKVAENTDIENSKAHTDPRSEVFQVMKMAVQGAIAFHQGGPEGSDTAAMESQYSDFSTMDMVRLIFEKISDFLFFTQASREFSEDKKKQLTPSYEAMLEGKDYEDLLRLSFYDVDFFGQLGTKVYNVKKVGDLSVRWGSVELSQSLKLVGKGSAEVIFSENAKNKPTYKTSINQWNQAAKNNKM